MIIQATPYGSKKEEPFAFIYYGDFTDSRVDGIGDVTLNTSGTLVVTGSPVTVSVYILAGGGGVFWNAGHGFVASGGGGGYQTVEVELVPGTYEIVIGAGGAAVRVSSGTEKKAGDGGATSAFGYTSSGGEGGYTTNNLTDYRDFRGGNGGSPNGGAGTKINSNTGTANGGFPNGGSYSNSFNAYPGGNGLVRITFS